MFKKKLIVFFAYSSNLFAMEKSCALKNSRDCMEQIAIAVLNCCESLGRPHIYRYNNPNRKKLNALEQTPLLVNGNVLLCRYMNAATKQDLIVYARNLSLKNRGLYFLTSDNDVFAAAVSKSVSNISLSTIINGLKKKYGATNIISFADADGCCFQGTLPSKSTNLENNLKLWMSEMVYYGCLPE